MGVCLQKRHGQLFQNRYESIVVEDDPYLMELTRYLHLTPPFGPAWCAISRSWTGTAGVVTIPCSTG